MIEPFLTRCKELKAFAINPVDHPDPDQSFKNRLFISLSVFGVDVVLMFILMLPIQLLEAYGSLDLDNHAALDMLKTMPWWSVLIATVIVAPLLEELIFRFPLRYKNNILVRSAWFVNSVLKLKNPEDFKSRLNDMWKQFYVYTFYLMAILFAIVHVFNFGDYQEIWMYTPFLVAPQLAVGILLGYLRVRFNYLSGVVLHGFHNLIFIGMALIMLHFEKSTLTLDTDEYTINIESISILDQPKQSRTSFYSDSTGYHIFYENNKLGSTLASLLKKDQMLIKSKNSTALDQFLNIRFDGSQENKVESPEIILKHLGEQYGFEIRKERELHDAWVLEVADSLLLAEQLAKPSEKSNKSFSDTNASVENSHLKDFAQSLTSSTNRLIRYSGTVNQNYDLSINTSDFEVLKDSLTMKYGLSLDYHQREVELIYVDF